HVLAHPEFPAAARTVRFGQIIQEGFTEALAVQLYDRLRERADREPAFKARLTVGVPGACPVPPKGKLGYEKAGESADRIRSTVGNDRFRAAYFLNARTLVGL